MSLRKQILDLNKRLDDLPIRQENLLIELLSDLKLTIKKIFGPDNQYLDYLKYVRFRPDAVFVTERELVRSWHGGKAQVLNLLRVILNDPLVRQGEAVDDYLEVSLNPEEDDIRRFSDLQGSILGTMNQFQKDALSRESLSVQDIGPIEEPLLKDSYMETALTQPRATKETHPLRTDPRVFVAAGSDQLINREVCQFLRSSSVQIIENEVYDRSRESLIDQMNRSAAVDFAVFILSGDFHFYSRTQSQEHASLMAAQEMIFQLGYFVAQLGRERVVVLYQENDRLRRPTEYFDIHYVPLDTKGTWKGEVVKRIQSCGFAIETSNPQVAGSSQEMDLNKAT